MESLSERNESQRLEKAKIWHKRRTRIIIIVVIAFIVLMGALTVWNYYTKCYKGYQVETTQKRADVATTVYGNYNGNLMKYNRDGAIGYDSKLKKDWSGSYNFASPIATASGKYVAIADLSGNEVYVFNGGDSPKKLDVLYPINIVKVSSNGLVAVAMSQKNTDLVQIYDTENKNQLLVEFKTNVSEDGYPISLALSEDGTKLVTSYLNVTTGTPVSKVTFYNLGEVGKNYTNNIVAAKTFRDKIISRVEFFGNDSVCVFGEKDFYLYTMKQLVEEVREKKFPGQIKSVFFTDSNFGFVLQSATADKTLKIEMYDLDGNAKLNKPIDFTYKDVYMVGENIIFLADQECHILRTNGTKKFHKVFSSPISYILPVDGYNRFILVNEKQIELVKLREE